MARRFSINWAAFPTLQRSVAGVRRQLGNAALQLALLPVQPRSVRLYQSPHSDRRVDGIISWVAWYSRLLTANVLPNC